MVAIQIELLTGRYAATCHNDRSRAEWPPHPARFFSALVAALHDREPVDAQEAEAIRWLEVQPPPSLAVDLTVNEDVGRRDVPDVYVPVNDVTLIGDPEAALREARSKAAADKDIRKLEQKLARTLEEQFKLPASPSKSDLKKAVVLLPDRRIRQVRSFPVVVPASPTFCFIWEQSPEGGTAGALEALCQRVTRLGHSSSLVRCAALPEAPKPALVPADDGPYVLRVVGPGQLGRLEKAHVRHQAVQPRVLPSRPQRYRLAQEGVRRSPPISSGFAGDWIVFERVGGERPLSSKAAAFTKALRASLLEQVGANPAPPAITGHTAEGKPYDGPHVAFVALPFVGHERADGSIQGLAIVPPRDLSAGDRECLLGLIAAWERSRAKEGILDLAGPNAPLMKFRRDEIPVKISLRPELWCRAATRFMTATPIALDRNPGNLRSNREGTAHRAAIEAQKSIAVSCERIGLPRPVYVEVSLAPLLPGAQPIRHFAPWPDRPGRPRKVRVHAEIRFDRIVKGPVLLGSGRHFGLGLCLPVQD